MHFLTDPLQYTFIQRALAAAVIVGILCACLGTFVVLRRMSLVGHALSHSALPGLVAAYLLGGPLLGGAIAATLLTAWIIGFMARESGVYEDTSIGMIPNIMFAIGIIMLSAAKSYRDLTSMLFGNLLGVTPADLSIVLVIAGLSLTAVGLFYKEIKLFCLDPMYARTIGIPVNAMRYGLLIVLALTVVVGVQAVGTVLTNALLVIPVAAARLLTNRLGRMIMLACLFAVISGVAGVYASYYFSVSSGAAVVLVCALLFAVAWLIKRQTNA